MPTNPIGTGTRNKTLNAPTDFLLAIDRYASKTGQSALEVMRDLLAKGAWLTDPKLAKELSTALANYYPDKRALYAIALLGLLSLQTLLHWQQGDSDTLRRASARVRIVRRAETLNA